MITVFLEVTKILFVGVMRLPYIRVVNRGINVLNTRILRDESIISVI